MSSLGMRSLGAWQEGIFGTWNISARAFSTLTEIIQAEDMALFISNIEDTPSTLENSIYRHAKAINALIYFINPYLVYVALKGEHEKDKDIKEYIELNYHLNRIFAHAKQLEQENKQTDNPMDFITQYLGIDIFNYILAIIDSIAKSIELFANEIAYYVINAYNNLNNNNEVIVSKLVNDYENSNYLDVNTLATYEILATINPLVYYAIPFILANIKLNMAMRKILAKKKQVRRDKQLLSNIKALIYLNTLFDKGKRFNDKGELYLEWNKKIEYEDQTTDILIVTPICEISYTTKGIIGEAKDINKPPICYQPADITTSISINRQLAKSEAISTSLNVIDL